ncbi:hypothetical protein [Bradyrhizobium sp. 141]|uniref:hypothetical protein n=1 Tax=Bradyrhizobium sp. 141 TaxID=2782617 RepID=UPI001FF77939|nr:hypothetical protein [Bradyrhizobium sp. 141]MCK1721321.1 hypothetical protein [Bradyrhizobium sp. 141]
MIAFLDASDIYVITELEEQCEDEGAAGDQEPSLGSTNSSNQERWAVGCTDDTEQEYDGREPDDRHR